MAKKKARKNYFKNSLAQRRQRFIGRLVMGLKVLLVMACLTGTSLLLILVYDALTQSSYFRAKTITVEGNRELSKKSILQLAGLKPHHNILSVNVNTLRRRLLTNSWVAAAEIERTLPDAIHIRVSERVPIAILDLEGFYYLDEKGGLFKPAEISDEARVPVVTGLSLSGFDFENPWRSQLFKAVVEVLRLSRRHDSVIPFESLQSVHVDRDIGLTLFASLASYGPPRVPVCTPALATTTEGGIPDSRSPATIKVGFGRYESKFSRLRDMVSYLRRESGFLNLRYVDVDDLDRVVVRQSAAGSSGSPSVAGDPDLESNSRKEV